MNASRRDLMLLLAAGVLAGLSMYPTPGTADSMSRARAPHAASIAELHLESGRLAVEIEIAAGDFAAFRNLLPDAIYRELARAPEPFNSRLRSFFENDFRVHAGSRGPLVGRVREVGLRPRTVGTAASLAIRQTAVDTVLRARLEYDLPHRPASLTFGGAVAGHAGIGFVLYHEGVAVNEFHYLSREQTVDLDWADPWDSRFRRKDYLRTSPLTMGAALYVSRDGVRKEVILRPKDLNAWVDLGIGGIETIPDHRMDAIKARAEEFLGGHLPLEIDGAAADPERVQMEFEVRTLGDSVVAPSPAQLDLNAALLKATYDYAIVEWPETVTMEWDLFSDTIEGVRGVTIDASGAIVTTLEPSAPLLEWENLLDEDQSDAPVAIPTPATLLTRAMHVMRWPVVFVAFLLFFWTAIGLLRRRRVDSARVGLAVVAIALSLTCFRLGQDRITDRTAPGLVRGLLHNMYLAGSDDVLRRYATDAALESVQKERRTVLGPGPGASEPSRFSHLRPGQLEAHGVDSEGFTATASWTVTARAAHWGHVHEWPITREADLRVSRDSGAWRISAFEPDSSTQH